MKGIKIKKTNGNNKKNFIFFVIAVFFVFYFAFFSDSVLNIFYYASSPIGNSLASLSNQTTIFFKSLTSKINLEKENESLKEERKNLVAEIIKLKEIEKENETLRKAMDLGINDDFNLIFAEVSRFDLFNDSFLINKGKKDGVISGMTVINQSKVIIGQIVDVYDRFSRVMIISHEKSSFFDAEVQRKDVTGIIKGQGNFNLILDLIPKEKEIENGDFILTMGEIFPKGLLVGVVNEVIKTDADPFQKAKISLLFNPRKIRNVFIITDY